MAPKKAGSGVNPKVEAARDRKEQAKIEAREHAAKEAENSYWKGAGEGEVSKAAKKREEAERQRLEAQKKRDEAKKLAEAEEASLTQGKVKTPKAAVAKVTQHQLTVQKEFEERQRTEEAKEREMNSRREVSEEKYSLAVEGENTNRQEVAVDARGIDEALSVLTVAGSEPADKHPEKRARAAWLAFEERELPALKEEKPGLKKSQYRDMLWKIWQKSPDNPLNQAAASGRV